MNWLGLGISNITEDEVRKLVSTKSSAQINKFKQANQQDGKKYILKGCFDIILDDYLELTKIRQVFKMIHQYKEEFHAGMDEEQENKRKSQINKAMNALEETNCQLLRIFEQKKSEAKEVQPQQRRQEIAPIKELIELNKLNRIINLLSLQAEKLLDNKQISGLHEELSKLDKSMTKETQNLLGVLKSHLHLSEYIATIQSDFYGKLKKIDESFVYEKVGLEAIEQLKDASQINHLYQKIQQFLNQNKTAFENLQIFNKDIIDSLSHFIGQILQPLQKKKEEEKEVIYILTNTSDIKNELQRILASYKDFIEENNKNSQEMIIKIGEYQALDAEYKRKLETLEKQKQNHEGQIMKLNFVVNQIREELARSTQAHLNCNNQSQELEAENNRLKSKINSVKRSLDKFNSQKKMHQEGRSLKDCLQAIYTELSSQIQNKISSYFSDLLQKNQDMQNQINHLKGKLSKNKNKLQEKQDLVNNLKKEIEGLEKSVKEMDDKLQEKKANELNLQEANNKIQALELRIIDLSREKQREKTQSGIKIEKLGNEVQALKRMNNSLKSDIKDAQRRQAEAISQKEEILTKIKQARDYERYFAHDVLYEFSFYKKAIIETIESRGYLPVKATRLLFKFDPLNKVNFHRYIDNIPHILLLVHLQNGRVLACYTNEPFKPQCKGDDAFIMVANTGKVFEMKKGLRAITFDDYYIIFGNSEIRLKSGEALIFSNFGIANSNFENQGNTVDALFGEGKDRRELPIAGYEIYGLVFEE